MVKRLVWMLVGATLGVGASLWLMRAVRQTVERYAPQRVSNELSEALRSVHRELRLAIAEGRDAMQERERVLRAELESRRSRP
jgi:hypothetical protein